jgi:uncharacterized DUF497 family protein
MELEFEWDPRKAVKNLRDHKVAFTEAATVFGDDLTATAYDPDHSIIEEPTSPWVCPIVADY